MIKMKLVNILPFNFIFGVDIINLKSNIFFLFYPFVPFSLMEKMCKICMEYKVSTMFMPCAHMVTCNYYALYTKSCPICKL